MAIAAHPKSEPSGATSFAHLSTSCACGAPAAVYYFTPFRAFCGRHAPSQLGPDRA